MERSGWARVLIFLLILPIFCLITNTPGAVSSSTETWTQTSQQDFEAGTGVNTDILSSPGDIKLSRTTTITLQPDPMTGKDAFVRYSATKTSYNDTNFGNESGLAVATLSNVTMEGTPWEHRSFIQFDLSLIPPFSEVASAELELYHLASESVWAWTGIGAHRVIQPWTETGVTWNNQPLFVESAEDQTQANFIETRNTWLTWDLTSLVQDWVNEQPNFGICLNELWGAYGYDLQSFASSDHPDLTLWPKLVVTYVGTYEGTFTSAPHNVGGPVDWGQLSWTEDVSPGTDIKFQLRTAITKERLLAAPWRDPDGLEQTFYRDASGEGIPSLHDGGRWIQYKAYLSTEDISKTPTLSDVTVSYSPMPGQIDLSVSDISFSNNIPLAGETIRISTTVSNTGNADAPPFAARFFDGDPAAGGLEIGAVEMLSLIAGESKTVQLAWTAPEGIHNIFVVVDAESTVVESNEANNVASVSISVVSEKPYFVWWGNPKALKYANVSAPGATVEEIPYWADRGGLAAGFVGLGPASIGYIDYGQTDRLRAALEQGANAGFPAIALEVERGTDSQDAQVLAEFKAIHPNIFIVAWLIGGREAHRWEELKNGVDLFLYEVYVNYGHPYSCFDNFIELARDYEILEKSVFALGTGGASVSEIEREFQYIRKWAPEMPGMALFGYGSAHDPEIDALCKKYFVDPVLTVSDDDISVSEVSPSLGQEITISVPVRNIGHTSVQDVTVQFFDGRPEEGRQIGNDQLISYIPAQGATEVSIKWNSTFGIHDIYARVLEKPNVTVLAKTAKKAVLLTKWWNKDWSFRFPVVIPDRDYDRNDFVQDMDVNFTTHLAEVGIANVGFDINSIRVVEYDSSGNPIAEIPSQFEASEHYDQISRAEGKLTWTVGGAAPKHTRRYFYIYFDTIETGGKSSPTYPTNLKQDGWTFSNDFYSASLDPSRGFVLTNLTPAGSLYNAMGYWPWGFTYGVDGQYYSQGAYFNPPSQIEEGPLYAKVKSSISGGGATLTTTYFFYSESPLVKIERRFEPGAGTVFYAAEDTGGIPQREGTWVLGHRTYSFRGQLFNNLATERYFGGFLGPGNEYKTGWFDWSWPADYNAGFGVAVGKRWTHTYSSLYDLTRHYDASDYIQVWEVYGGSMPIPQTETSVVYLVPHNFLDLSDPTVTAPAQIVWDQSHTRLEPAAKTEAYQAPGLNVTGGGFIVKDKEKCNFGFTGKYVPDSLIPQGQFEYVDRKLGITLHSVSLDWLIITGKMAVFEGTAMVNGQGLQKFKVIVRDNGSPGVDKDTFELRVDGVIVSSGTLKGGNITIH